MEAGEVEAGDAVAEDVMEEEVVEVADGDCAGWCILIQEHLS